MFDIDDPRFKVGPTYHSHSLEEVNAGIFHPGESCDQCPPREDLGTFEVVAVDRDTGTITLK